MSLTDGQSVYQIVRIKPWGSGTIMLISLQCNFDFMKKIGVRSNSEPFERQLVKVNVAPLSGLNHRQRWSSSNVTKGLCFFSVTCIGPGVLIWCGIERKNLYPFAIYKISWSLAKTLHSLLKWDSLPASGVTGKVSCKQTFCHWMNLF